jgi:hypothetical protein
MAHSAGVYLGDFEVDFETNLGYESEGQVGSFFYKKRRSVISRYYPFKWTHKSVKGDLALCLLLIHKVFKTVLLLF